ncbi:hypothetical protein ACTU6V_12445 [Microbacterium sp. A204]|uniref:hypothetical protein n=1 Tax=Microbacterium sp. A204 TaxID=3457321 RepID=UPI003FD31EEE
MVTDLKALIARNNSFADRLMEAYVNRAGSEDPHLMVQEFVGAYDEAQEALDGLAQLVLTLAERAADLSTPVDIWDPERRIDRAKAIRLASQTKAAFQDLKRELNTGGK